MSRSRKRRSCSSGVMCRNSLTRRIPEVDQHALELVDLTIGASPFLGGRQTFDALHQHAAIPGPVEHNNLPLRWQTLPEALKVVLGALMLIRRGNWVDFETTRIESPAETPDDAALAGGIPSLKHEQCPLRSSEIRLLDELKRPLQRSETPLVVGEVHFGRFGDLRESRTAPDHEIHCVI